jgi:preprotein translocase SecE subunit
MSNQASFLSKFQEAVSMATKKKGRNTQPASNSSKAAASKNKDRPNQAGWLTEGRQFLKDVYLEFNKITWPQRQQVVQETISVLFLVTIITLMVLAFDWVLGTAVFGPLEHWARIIGGGVGRG